MLLVEDDLSLIEGLERRLKRAIDQRVSSLE